MRHDGYGGRQLRTWSHILGIHHPLPTRWPIVKPLDRPINDNGADPCDAAARRRFAAADCVVQAFRAPTDAESTVMQAILEALARMNDQSVGTLQSALGDCYGTTEE